MERSWSRRALEALEAYPWPDSTACQRAKCEVELLAAGDVVVWEDLPTRVRKWTLAHEKVTLQEVLGRLVWQGEPLMDVLVAFEKTILAQALEKHAGNVADAARALATTARIVRYKANKYAIPTQKRAHYVRRKKNLTSKTNSKRKV